jgi:alpha-maltose-1-phosphate synthase
MFVLSHPRGNQNVRAALRALEAAGMLTMFFTTVGWREPPTLSAFMPPGLRGELTRRSFPEIAPSHLSTFARRELLRQLVIRLGLDHVSALADLCSIDVVDRAFDACVAQAIGAGVVGARAIYAYEDAALQSFEIARTQGLRRFYELPTLYWKTTHRLMEEEAALQPIWSATNDTLNDGPEKLARKDRELGLADHIIVPSEFVRATLMESGGLHATIDVLPYGGPPASATPRAVSAPNEKLRLLFVGHLRQRKGLSYLFDAMETLASAATLTLIGPKPVDCAVLNRALGCHRWLGAVPHARVLDEMRRHDVLVLPSLIEGFALVILEAMAQGLPVITTPNSGAATVIENGVDGFIVPIRNSEAIVDRVMRLANRADLSQMSAAALEKAVTMSWANQERRFIELLRMRLESA